MDESVAKEISDTKIFLEWDAEKIAWVCPLVSYDWAEPLCLLRGDGAQVSKVDASEYAIEKSHDGEVLIPWLGDSDSIPERAWLAVAVKPKSSDRFLGIPIQIFTPIFGAITAAIGVLFTMYVQSPTQEVDLDNWIEKSVYDELKQEHDLLLPYKLERDRDSFFAVERSFEDRVNFLLGQSHGIRIEAYKKLLSEGVAQDLILQAESSSLESLLGSKVDDSTFTSGKGRGQADALSLLSFGETETFSGSDFSLTKMD